MDYKVFNIEGKEVDTIQLDESVFGVEYNPALIHQVTTAYGANNRQGTKSALTRTEVRGGGKKPWRQKGTGRARQGSIRAPQWIKGGVVFAPKPRDFSQKVNRRVKIGAIRSALSEKVRTEELVIINKLDIEAKTKNVANMIEALNLKNGKTMIVYDGENQKAVLAARNIPSVNIACVDLLSVYEVVNNANLVITQSAVKKLEEVYGQ